MKLESAQENVLKVAGIAFETNSLRAWTNFQYQEIRLKFTISYLIHRANLHSLIMKNIKA